MNTGTATDRGTAAAGGGLAAWLLERMRGGGRRQAPRLALIERINLAPRQSLALVEAEGRRFLVASSPEGAPAFYPLDRTDRNPGLGPLRAPADAARARVSW